MKSTILKITGLAMLTAALAITAAFVHAADADVTPAKKEKSTGEKFTSPDHRAGHQCHDVDGRRPDLHGLAKTELTSAKDGKTVTLMADAVVGEPAAAPIPRAATAS